jgi:hypothetical protein
VQIAGQYRPAEYFFPCEDSWNKRGFLFFAHKIFMRLMYMAIENDLFGTHFSNALSIYGK